MSSGNYTSIPFSALPHSASGASPGERVLTQYPISVRSRSIGDFYQTKTQTRHEIMSCNTFRHTSRATPSMNRHFLQARGLSDQNNRNLASHLEQVVREAGIDCQQIGVPFGTDAAEFGATGVPTVVFGPGNIAQAHTADEWIEIDQLQTATEILIRWVQT